MIVIEYDSLSYFSDPPQLFLDIFDSISCAPLTIPRFWAMKIMRKKPKFAVQ